MSLTLRLPSSTEPRAAGTRPSPDAPAVAAITLDGIAHTYSGQTGRVHALAPVGLSIPKGQFVAILGPSGCGKTTLLRIISGLLEPSAGRILLGGAPPAYARRHRSIGWLAQDDGLLPWRNVLENVELPLRIARRNGRASALDILDRVGLASAARQYPHELSGGMRQRAALARALVARPPFVFLDEPFAHLDELTRERLGELLLDLRGQSVVETPTTVLVTHSVAEAVHLADRVVVLSERPARLVQDTAIELPHPRLEDSPAVGRLVRSLKSALTHQPMAYAQAAAPGSFALPNSSLATVQPRLMDTLPSAELAREEAAAAAMPGGASIGPGDASQAPRDASSAPRDAFAHSVTHLHPSSDASDASRDGSRDASHVLIDP